MGVVARLRVAPNGATVTAIAMAEPVVLRVELTPEQVETIADHVAGVLAARGASHPPGGSEVAPFIPVKEAARLLGLAPKTVYAMFSDGRLTRHGVSGRALASRAEVEALASEEGSRSRPSRASRTRGRVPARTFTERARRV